MAGALALQDAEAGRLDRRGSGAQNVCKPRPHAFRLAPLDTRVGAPDGIADDLSIGTGRRLHLEFLSSDARARLCSVSCQIVKKCE